MWCSGPYDLSAILTLTAGAVAEGAGETAVNEVEEAFTQSVDVDTVNHVDHECLHEHCVSLGFGNAALTHVEQRFVVKLTCGCAV